MENTLQKIGENNTFTAFCVGFLSAQNEKTTWSWSREQGTGANLDQALFDCASITKVWPTGEVINLGFEQGWLNPDKTLSFYLPETAEYSCGQHTLRELHTFHVEWKLTLSQQKHLSAQPLWQKLLETPTNLSGTAIYSNATSIFLGKVLERVQQQRLDAIAQEFLFEPLGLQKTTFFPQTLNSMIIPSEIDAWRGRELRGEVHDESAWILQQAGEVPGSAGLFSCVQGLLTLAQWQLEESHSQGAGWEPRSHIWMGQTASNEAYGKTGFTGTSVVIDPTKRCAAVILTNFCYPHRPNNHQPLDELRKMINTLLLVD